jgi:hypothetical protein
LLTKQIKNQTKQVLLDEFVTSVTNEKEAIEKKAAQIKVSAPSFRFGCRLRSKATMGTA